MSLESVRNILWDFDGVLMDSMPVRDKGFEVVLANFPSDHVSQLMDFHRKNGGLSRYVKFRYFFETIRNEKITEESVLEYATAFSQIMRQSLLNASLLIEDSVRFVQHNHARYNMHIVSGSDQEELRFICEKLELKKYFKSIHGSPTPKKKLVEEVLDTFSYEKENTILIGDSGNDYEAAQVNNIMFAGYNNPELRSKGEFYIDNFVGLSQQKGS